MVGGPRTLVQTRKTVANYDVLPDDGHRYELMFGELYEMQAEGFDPDRLMTAADLAQFSPEGPRYEIIGGMLFPVPDVENTFHYEYAGVGEY